MSQRTPARCSSNAIQTKNGNGCVGRAEREKLRIKEEKRSDVHDVKSPRSLDILLRPVGLYPCEILDTLNLIYKLERNTRYSLFIRAILPVFCPNALPPSCLPSSPSGLCKVQCRIGQLFLNQRERILALKHKAMQTIPP